MKNLKNVSFACLMIVLSVGILYSQSVPKDETILADGWSNMKYEECIYKENGEFVVAAQCVSFGGTCFAYSGCF